jgi:hypothetical protein
MARRNTTLPRGAGRQPPKPPPVPPDASPGKRWRFRRNLVICVAYRSGLSQRFLADVFDLPRSRIAEIVREFQGYVEP